MRNEHTALPWVDKFKDHEANARFIVQACNSHDDLVAALEAILEAIRKGKTIFANQGGIWEEGKQALNKAKEVV